MKRTTSQILLAQHLREMGLRPEFEYQFHAGRKWRADIALVEQKILIECDGGMRSGGHRRGLAINEENEKLNTASMMAWRILKFTNEFIDDGRAKDWIYQALLGEKLGAK